MNIQQKGQRIRQIINDVREKEFPYERKSKTKRDWAMIDLAQRSELPDVLHMIGAIVDAAWLRIHPHAEEKHGPGRPRVPPDDLVKTMITQSVFGYGNRRAEGLYRSLAGPLKISGDFSYKTIERGFDPCRTQELLEEVFRMTNLPVRHLESVFSIDGTGLTMSLKHNYENERRRERDRDQTTKKEIIKTNPSLVKKHEFVLGIGIVGTVSKMFTAWKSNTDKSKGEVSFYKELLDTTMKNRKGVKMMLGDGAYGFREFCTSCSELGIIPRTLPRRNITFKRKGAVAWVRMLLHLLDDPQQWLAEYHQRSLSETANSMLHAYNPFPIRKRIKARRELESDLRPIAHNIRRLCALVYLINLKIDFFAQQEQDQMYLEFPATELVRTTAEIGLITQPSHMNRVGTAEVT